MFEKLKAPNSESEITKHWKYTDKVYVSVVCITYNQETYIRDAIDSFLAQETEYKFEIIIHDDASEDTTAQIISEYQSKYPNIIRAINQKENQYSKSVCRPCSICFDKAKGEYIALCEGDDFWVDKKKLSKQIKLLTAYPSLNICFSKSISLYPNGECENFCDLGDENKLLSFDEVIIGPEKDFFPTATFLFRAKIIKTLPNWFFTKAVIGDYYIQSYAAHNEGAAYIGDNLAVYRREALGSYNATIEPLKRVFNDKIRAECKELMLNEMELTSIEKKALVQRILRFRLSAIYWAKMCGEYKLAFEIYLDILKNNKCAYLTQHFNSKKKRLCMLFK